MAVNKFQSDKVNHEASSLMFPILLPLLYGRHEEDVNDAAATLLWIGRGLVGIVMFLMDCQRFQIEVWTLRSLKKLRCPCSRLFSLPCTSPSISWSNFSVEFSSTVSSVS